MSSISDVSSVASSDESGVEHLILDQPIYYVLNQFLVTDDGKNIATCIQEFTQELRELRKVIADSKLCDK